MYFSSTLLYELEKSGETRHSLPGAAYTEECLCTFDRLGLLPGNG